MTKLLIIIFTILLSYLSSPCFSQSTNQFVPEDCVKDGGWQFIIIEDAHERIPIHHPYEKQAHFPGGKDSLTAFIKRNLQWPPTIFCGQGTVYIEFIVDSSGVITDQKILHGVCENYDKEALRIISLMPNWIPAKNLKQIATESKINLPIKFRFE